MTESTTITTTAPLENLEKTGEKPKHPAVTALAGALPQDSMAAATLLGELASTMCDALPKSSQRDLAAYRDQAAVEAHAVTARDAKAARALADAASYREQAARRTANAEALAAMTPGDYALMVAQAQAKQVRDAAQREKRAGAGSVTVWSDDRDVEVNKEDLADAGYHHRSECGTGEGDTLAPDHVLIQSVWDGLRDFHDKAHGLTSWTGCPEPACAAIPEAWKRSAWHHVKRVDY